MAMSSKKAKARRPGLRKTTCKQVSKMAREMARGQGSKLKQFFSLCAHETMPRTWYVEKNGNARPKSKRSWG